MKAYVLMSSADDDLLELPGNPKTTNTYIERIFPGHNGYNGHDGSFKGGGGMGPRILGGVGIMGFPALFVESEDTLP